MHAESENNRYTECFFIAINFINKKAAQIWIRNVKGLILIAMMLQSNPVAQKKGVLAKLVGPIKKQTGALSPRLLLELNSYANTNCDSF